MIEYTRRAERQIDLLRQYYEAHQRLEALRNLDAALDEAEARIERDPGAGVPAPRPYPFLVRKGRGWIRVRRYWFAYSTAAPHVIVGVYYDTADIPNRV